MVDITVEKVVTGIQANTYKLTVYKNITDKDNVSRVVLDYVQTITTEGLQSQISELDAKKANIQAKLDAITAYNEAHQ